ncbi:MAG TPA: hypothetical protein VFB54_13655 [Burkholderiales bacterium]|nr:hypothetical protein [Burkholderiales bacterium]
MTTAVHQPLVDWSADELRAFGVAPVRLHHQLHQHALFSDDHLARILERLERDDYYVNTMNTSRHDLTSRREGEIKGLSGIEVLEAVRTGRIWILVLQPDRLDSAYAALLRQIYDEISNRVPGFRTFHEKMTLLISSPNIQVYYHADVPGQTLWQVRGHKRVYVYPNKEPFLDQACLEKIVLGEAHEISLPYREEFDRHATVFDLLPGEMLHWPLNAPHRIVNGDCVNVSFTTEHFTAPIRRQYYVNFANGILRHRFGFSQLSQHTSGFSYWAKVGLAAAYKLTGNHKKRRKLLHVEFAVDPHAQDGVRTIPGYAYRR